MPLIARSLVRQGVDVTVATTNDHGRGNTLPVKLGEMIEADGYKIIYFSKQTEFYKFSWPLARWLLEHVRDYDLVHIHALFSFSSVAAAYVARLAGVPYIIRPLGVLNRWGFQNRRRLIKAISFRVLEGPIIRHAAAMHYTSTAEQQEALEAGVSAPGLVIPLGIDLEPFLKGGDAETFYGSHPRARGRKVILFLSRVDQKKGLDLLLPAFAQVRKSHPDALLVIAGDGPPEYRARLEVMARDLGISDEVLWTGHLEGVLKLAAFAAATLYVLPSYSENFGIAAVEALAAGVPSVLSSGVAIASLVEAHGGCITTTQGATPIAEKLILLLSDDNERAKVAKNARIASHKLFESTAMAQQLINGYETVLK